ncbi:hypothetical protein O181_045345 [Austropuccinia psidii MF-1]|uniref:Uncharacterized protein n=1 Tax=Austropuccinia psidii MF-1 TaxID=1389203 RepID=A0A9Q3HL45_9BASI|nr:hypothetical protein [Austropuccinia psidii MF-1]
MVPLGPFCPESNEAKRGQGGSPPAPKARCVPNPKWAHLSQFWPLIPSISKWPKRTSAPKLAKNNSLSTFNPCALGSTRGHQLRSSKASPQLRGSTLLHQCTPYQRIQVWCTIFAQQSNDDVFRTQLFLSNSSPQIHHPFQRKTFHSLSLAIPGGYQKTI